MTRRRVTPSRKAPVGTGVRTTPSFTMKTLALASSATSPRVSSIKQLPKPRLSASRSARAPLGYRLPVLASTGALSRLGRRNGDRVTAEPVGGGMGVS